MSSRKKSRGWIVTAAVASAAVAVPLCALIARAVTDDEALQIIVALFAGITIGNALFLGFGLMWLDAGKCQTHQEGSQHDEPR